MAAGPDEGIVIKDFLEQKKSQINNSKPTSKDHISKSETADIISVKEQKIQGYGLNFFVCRLALEKIAKSRDITVGASLDDFNPGIHTHGGEGRVVAKTKKRTNPYSKDQSTYSRYQGEGSFFLNNMIGKLDLFSFLSAEREEDEEYIPIHYKLLFGIVGLKFDFLKGEEFQEFSIGYAPLYESNDFERIQGGIRSGRSKENFIRHLFQLQVKAKVWESTALKGTFRWKPKHDLKEKSFKSGDSDTTLLVDLSMRIFRGLSFSYLNELRYDRYRKEIQSLPSTDWQQSLNLNYGFDL